MSMIFKILSILFLLGGLSVLWSLLIIASRCSREEERFEQLQEVYRREPLH